LSLSDFFPRAYNIYTRFLRTTKIQPTANMKFTIIAAFLSMAAFAVAAPIAAGMFGS
jgi:hypothetical protein